MSLTFLTPMLLAGAALIALPIIIHLIMRQKPKHLMFPAFRFLLQKHRTTVQKLRLRHLLLLALRIGLILLICGALARPELSGGADVLGDDAPVALVLIFDTSPSMEYLHDGQSRLDTAKAHARSLLESLPSSSRVAVFDTAEPGGQFVYVADGLKQVQNRRIQAFNRPVTASVEDAYRLLTREPPETPVLICVFSDRTAASWNAEAVGSVLRQAKQRMEQKLPNPIPAYYVDLGVKEPRNISISGLALKQGNSSTPLEGLAYGSTKDELVQLQATVQVTGAGVDTVLLLYLDNQEKDSKRLKVVAQPEQTITETITFKAIPRTAAAHQGEVKLKGADALEADNARYFTLTSSPRSVLILASKESDAFDWQFALEESPLPIKCTVLQPRDLPGNLNPDQFQAVCLLNVGRPHAELWETLQRYLAAGGGVVFLPGEDSDADAYASDAALALLPARLVEKVDIPAPRAWLAPTNYDHPIMERFKSWEKQTLPGRISRHWRVETVGETSRTVLPMNWRDETGLRVAPVIVEKLFNREKIAGRAILFTTAMYRRPDWREGWNSFHDVGNWLGLALPYLSVRHVMGAREEKQNLVLGDDLRFWLPRGGGLNSYQLAGPQNASGEIKEKDTQVIVTDARKPGNYKAHSGEVWVRQFSVNLPAAETELLAGGPSHSEIEAVFGEGSWKAGGDSFDLREMAFERLGRAPKRELLPYLMIGVLLFLALENLLSNRFYKREE